MHVRLGRIGEGNIDAGFGVDEGTRGSWCSNDTLEFSSGGLFIPPQFIADRTKMLDAKILAKLDVWGSLSQLANIAAGAPAPSRELPSAPGWQYERTANDDGEPALLHPLIGIQFFITPMELA